MQRKDNTGKGRQVYLQSPELSVRMAVDVGYLKMQSWRQKTSRGTCASFLQLLQGNKKYMQARAAIDLGKENASVSGPLRCHIKGKERGTPPDVTCGQATYP